MITSHTNQTIKSLMKLKQAKYRRAMNAYLIEGYHLVQEAKKAGNIECIIATQELDESVPVIVVSEAIMEKLSFTKTPQPIMAKCSMNRDMKIIDGNRYLLLDGLQDPGNIGTLIRSGLAFGITQVILSHDCVDLYNDKLLRSMQGAHFHISCIKGDLLDYIQMLKKQGVTIVGSALENGKEINQIDQYSKMAYIVGNEGNGIKPEVLSSCDEIAYIPISNIDSLNVAIAGSIMMYHFQPLK